MREKLTNNEYKAVLNFTALTRLDLTFDICRIDENTDGFKNKKTGKKISLEKGFEKIKETIADAPLQVLRIEQQELLKALVEEFC